MTTLTKTMSYVSKVVMFYGIYINTFTIKQITRIYATTLSSTNISE